MFEVMFISIVAFASGWLFGYVLGVNTGVNETEERWAEAVGRADDARTGRQRTCGKP